MYTIRSISFRSIASGFLVACPILLHSSSVLFAQEKERHEHGDVHGKASEQASAKTEFKGDPYLLDFDPVSGKALGPIEQQVVLVHEGRELRFSSQENAKAFQAESAMFLAAIDAKIVEQQLPFYPLETCVVSGEKLGGEMGDPVDFVFKNRLVRFCCKDCKPKFLADPAKYITELDKAVIAKQMPTYPLKTCVVSAEELGGEMGDPIDIVFGNRLVRFCCKACQKDFRKDPRKFLAELDAAMGAGVRGEHGKGPRHENEDGGK